MSPLWAGLIAVLNSGRPQPVGFITPKLYALGPSAQALRDIIAGDNGVNKVKGYKAKARLGCLHRTWQPARCKNLLAAL